MLPAGAAFSAAFAGVPDAKGVYEARRRKLGAALPAKLIGHPNACRCKGLPDSHRKYVVVHDIPQHKTLPGGTYIVYRAGLRRFLLALV